MRKHFLTIDAAASAGSAAWLMAAVVQTHTHSQTCILNEWRRGRTIEPVSGKSGRLEGWIQQQHHPDFVPCSLSLPLSLSSAPFLSRKRRERRQLKHKIVASKQASKLLPRPGEAEAATE